MPIDPSDALIAQLTDNEVLVIQEITNGTYFVDNEVPTGSINSSNTTFTISQSLNPVGSLKVYLGGVRQLAGGVDFIINSTETSAMIVFNNAPPTGIKIVVDYHNSPV